jgi:hypothetical protein
MSTRSGLSTLTVFLAALAVPGAAAGEEMRVGIAASLQESVTGIVGDGKSHPLVLGEDLFFNEHIITTTTSSAVVEFRDRSTLEIGPNATIILDKSVYNPIESVSDKSITVVAGAFRFVSGVAAQKSETDIHTPVGTLGIRGSAVFGNVYPQGDFIGGVAQGNVFFDHNGQITNVPEGQAIVAIFSTGQVLATPPLPFASFFKSFGSKFGNGPGNLQGFSPNQQTQNGKDDNTPSGQQGGTGGGGGNPPPQNQNGNSDLKTFFSSFHPGSGGNGGAGGNGGDGNFVTYLFNSSGKQHNSNGVNGVGGVIGDLSGSLPPTEVIQIATGWASHDPGLGPAIALWLIHQFPGMGQQIYNALAGVLPKEELAEIASIINQGSNGNNGNGNPQNNNSPPLPPNPNDPT